ncbi:hypothetical protein DIPPA_09356 [Diplonema papillatum]|nr:hypothetical protein DIPPA_34469 [Diplonema papillatum]KAJ9450596.1 hypothetical protein DIPPA_09356 [Diplonema papillatum]
MWRDEERAAEERLAALHERYATREGEAKRRLDRELARYEDRHAQLLQVLRRAGDSGSGGDNIKNTTATTTTTTTSSSSSSSNNNDSSGSSSADGAAAIKSGKSEGGELGRRESEGGPAPAAGKKSGADRRRHEAERVAVERELGRMRAEVADAERRKAALDAEAREAELRIQRRQRELRRLQECQGEQQAAEQEHRRTLEELQSKIKRRETQVDEQMARRIRLPDSESRTSCTLPMDRNYSGAKPQRDSVHRKGQEADHTASDDSLQAALVPPRRASCVDDWPRTHSKSGDKRRPSDKQRDRELQTAFKEAVIAERERDNARRNSGVVPSDRQDMPPMADHFEFETLVSQSLDSVLMLYPRFSDNYFSCAPQRQQEIMRAWVMRDRDAWLKERLLRCFYSGSFSEVSTSSPRLLPKDVHASAFSTPALSPISGSPELSSSRDPPPPADDAAGVVLGLGSSADPSRDDRPAQFRRWSRGSIDTGARHTSGVR